MWERSLVKMNAINECSFHSKWTKFPDKNFVKILLTKLLLYEKNCWENLTRTVSGYSNFAKTITKQL